MEDLKRNFPEGIDYSVVYDPTIFVRHSIEAVIHRLLEAILLVVLVVIVFLQTWRAALIPLAAVPVSLIGTFSLMGLGEPGLLHAGERQPHLSRLLRLRQYVQRQPPHRPRDDFHCLRYWVHNYHVDGFRFDLASILSRNREGELVPNPPVVESIAEDPVWPTRRSSPRRGTPRADTRWAVSAACAGRNGTATTATTCGVSGGAIPT